MTSPRPTLGRLAANTVVQAVGLVGTSALGFATFLLAVRGLGPRGYGDFTAATVYLFLPVVLADVGLSTSMLREIAARPERSSFVMSRALPLRLLVSLALLGFAVPLAFVLPFNAQARDAILIGSIGSLFTLLNASLLPLLQAELRLHVAVAANLAGRIVTLGLTAAALAVDSGLRGFVLAAVVGVAATFFLDLAFVARSIPLRPVFDMSFWRWLLRDSLEIGLANSIFQSYFRIDTVLLALLRPAREVGLYGAAYKFVELGESLVASIGITMFPTFSRMVADRDPRLHAAVQRSVELVGASVAPLVVAMLAAPDEIMQLLAGDEFDSAAVALQLLAPYLLLVVMTSLVWRVLAALREDRFLLVIATIVLVVNVGLNLALLPRFGFNAAALTSVASELVVLGAAVYVVARELRYVPSLRYLAVLVPAALAMCAVVLLVPGHVVLRVAAGSGVYVALLVLLPGTVRDVSRRLWSRAPAAAG